MQKIGNFIGFAYLVSEGVEGREDMGGLDFIAGLFTVDLRTEIAGFEKDLQREAIVEHGREKPNLGFWG